MMASMSSSSVIGFDPPALALFSTPSCWLTFSLVIRVMIDWYIFLTPGFVAELSLSASRHTSRRLAELEGEPRWAAIRTWIVAATKVTYDLSTSATDGAHIKEGIGIAHNEIRGSS
jgi:hypothetical protein